MPDHPLWARRTMRGVCNVVSRGASAASPGNRSSIEPRIVPIGVTAQNRAPQLQTRQGQRDRIRGRRILSRIALHHCCQTRRHLRDTGFQFTDPGVEFANPARHGLHIGARQLGGVLHARFELGQPLLQRGIGRHPMLGPADCEAVPTGA